MKLRALLVCAVLAACDAPDTSAPPRDHVWKTQTDMIERAHDVDGLLRGADARQRERIEAQTR